MNHMTMKTSGNRSRVDQHVKRVYYSTHAIVVCESSQMELKHTFCGLLRANV